MADLDVSFGAQIEGAVSGINSLTSKIEGMVAPVTALQSAFKGLGEVLIAALAVEKVAQFVESMSELGAAALHASTELGITTTELTKFQFAAGAMGVETESANMSLVRLERNIGQAATNAGGGAARAFAALGVSVRDSHGNIKSMEELLPEIAQRFAETQDGIEKTAIALAIGGRGFAQMIPVLDQGVAGLKKWADEADATGTVISGPMAEGMERTGQSIYTLGKAFEGVGITIYEAFKPAIDDIIKGLTNLVEGFNDGIKTGGNFNRALGLIVAVVDGVIGAFDILSATVKSVFAAIGETFDGIVVKLQFLAKAVQDAATLNWSKIGDDWAAGTAQLDAITAAGVARQKAIWGGLSDDLAKLYSNINKTLAVGTTGAGIGDHHPDEGGGLAKLPGIEPPGGNKDKVAQWQADLDLMIAKENGFYADSTQMEINYWSQKLSTLSRGSAEWATVYEKLFALQKKQANEALQEELASLNAQQAAKKNDFAAQQALEQQKLALLASTLGVRSRQYQEELRKEETMEETHQKELNAIQLQAVNHNLQILKLQLSNASAEIDQEYSLNQISAQKKQQLKLDLLAKEYAAELDEINKELALGDLSLAQIAALNQKKLVLKQQYINAVAALSRQEVNDENAKQQQLAQKITGSFNTILNGILQGTQSIGDAFGRMVGNMLITFIQAVDEMIVEWLIFEALGIGSNPLAGTAGSIFGKLLGFASGAWEIPHDMVAMIHKGEMIVPAAEAEQARAGGNVASFGQGNRTNNAFIQPQIGVSYAGHGRISQDDIEQHANFIAQTVAEQFTRNPSMRPAWN